MALAMAVMAMMMVADVTEVGSYKRFAIEIIQRSFEKAPPLPSTPELPLLKEELRFP